MWPIEGAAAQFSHVRLLPGRRDDLPKREPKDIDIIPGNTTGFVMNPIWRTR